MDLIKNLSIHLNLSDDELLHELNYIIECQKYEPLQDIQIKFNCAELWNNLQKLVELFCESGVIYVNLLDEYLLNIMEIMNNPSHISKVLHILKQIEKEMEVHRKSFVVRMESTTTDENEPEKLYHKINDNLPGIKALKSSWINITKITNEINSNVTNIHLEINNSLNDHISINTSLQKIKVLYTELNNKYLNKLTIIKDITTSRNLTGVRGDNLIEEFVKKIENL
eukprot:117323_1